MSIVTQYHGEQDGRGLSSKMWEKIDVREIFTGGPAGFSRGYGFYDDFMDLLTGRYTATQATAGTFALDDAEGGVALADSNSTTDTQGITVQTGGSAGEAFLTGTAQILAFEARVKLADVATPPEFFLGLSEIDTTLIASGANSSANHLGFEITSDSATVIDFHAEVAGTRTSQTSVHTFADDTWVKLGFKVVNRSRIEIWVDGVKNATQLTAGFPLVEMAPSLVCQSNGTTDPIVHIDWWAAAVQLRAE